MTRDRDLLQQYARHHAEEAFAELVRRHLNLVYSAALRQVRSPQLAEEVAQSVFADLAGGAGRLKPDTILTAWLYQVTRRTAIDVVRHESRRQARERLALEMTDMNSTSAEWMQIEPLLDEAMHALDDTDRAAVLLRYFENKSLREVGRALGTSEDAAQKRVSRAVERLREFFSKHGVTVGASGLMVVVSANAVQAAPIGLAATISTSASLAGTTLITTSAASATKTIAMTTLQKSIVAVALVAAVGTGIYETRQADALRRQIQTLREQQAEHILQLTRELDDANRKLGALRDDNARLNRNAAELMKLRGEVAQLRMDSQELARLKAGEAGNVNGKPSDPIESSAQAWLAKVNHLKELQEQMPDKNIPELRYLKDRDWLITVQDANLEVDAEVRAALSELRDLGKRRFAKNMWDALRKFAQANNQLLPTDLLQLKSYFAPPVDDATLQRYQMSRTGSVNDLKGEETVVAEKAVVDDQYDTLFEIGVKGWRMRGTGTKNSDVRASQWGP